MDIIRNEVKNIERYSAGKPISEVKRELGLDTVVKLASNENPLGCSPRVKKVLKEAIEEVGLYPDSASFDLRAAISKELNVKKDEVFCGAGSDALIRVICSTVLNPGDESIMAEITFPRYETSVKLMGATAVKIPMKNHGLDVDKMVEAINERTKIIWLCNPNNPTGNIFTKEDFERIVDRIPQNVLFVMDEAYIEYVESDCFPNSLDYRDKYPNMIILRTFSKAYGLASLRCGYGIAKEELIQYFNRAINPFDVNLFAQKAAETALGDKDFLKVVKNANREGKQYLYAEFTKLSLKYIETEANFIMVNVERDDMEVFGNLMKKGFIVRPGTLLGMVGWLRVTIGTMEQNQKFIKALKEILQ